MSSMNDLRHVLEYIVDGLENPNRSLNSDQILLDYCVDSILFARRRSELRLEPTREKMTIRK